MKKHLFRADNAYCIDAQELDRETIQAVKKIFEKYVEEEGYPPREVEYVMTKAISDLSLSFTLGPV
jgi:hypothetical protein